MKTAEAARMSPLAVARARGKSSDLTIWVTPHQEEKTGGTREGRKDGTCGVIICFRVLLQFFFSPSLCSGGWEGEKEEEEEGGGAHTHMGVLFLSSCLHLTWSGAVLRSFALHFLQAAIVHFLQ